MGTQHLTRLLPLLLLVFLPNPLAAFPEHGFGSANSHDHEHEEHHEEAMDNGNDYYYYDYNLPEHGNRWAVEDDAAGLDFGQDETKNGDSVKGFYYALLPDNRKQTVTYEVNGDSGYTAHVSYDEEDDHHSDEAETSPVYLYKPPATTPPHTYKPPTTTPYHHYTPPITTPYHHYTPPTTTPPHTYKPPTTTHGYNYDPPKTPVNLYETPSAAHLDLRTASRH